MKRRIENRKETGCEEILNMLSPFMDNELNPNERLLVEKHLQYCQPCREELDSLRRTVNMVKQIPEISSRRSFAVSETDISPKTWNVRLSTLSGAAALVAVALLLIFIGDIKHYFDAPPLPPPPFPQPPEIERYYWPVRETEFGLLGTFSAIALYTLLYWLSRRRKR